MAHSIREHFDLCVPGILRTADEITSIVGEFPFSEGEVVQAEEANDEDESRYLILFDRALTPEETALLVSFESNDDHVRINGRNAHLLLHHSIRHSKLAGNLSHLNATWTTRNWKTICTLESLARAHGISCSLA